MKHPDCRPGETWIGNIEATSIEALPEYLKPLQSIRLDGTAYDISGNPLPPDQYRPLIMSQTDSMRYNRIMGERLTRIHRGERL